MCQREKIRSRPGMKKLSRCTLGKHEWRLRKGRIHEWEDERTYYWCINCGKIRDNPPRHAGGGAEAPIYPGGPGGPYGA
jgi:hypothetical protein